MMADATAFSGLVFGYYLLLDDPPRLPADRRRLTGPGVFWPMVALALTLTGWAATVGAREVHAPRQRRCRSQRCWWSASSRRWRACSPGSPGRGFRGSIPNAHVYPAIVWTLAIWTAAHAAIGVIMQAYTLARSLAGKMTPRL